MSSKVVFYTFRDIKITINRIISAEMTRETFDISSGPIYHLKIAALLTGIFI